MKKVWLAIGSMKTSELFYKFREGLHMQLVSGIIETKIVLSEEADILFSCMWFGYFCISLSLIKTQAKILMKFTCMVLGRQANVASISLGHTSME